MSFSVRVPASSANLGSGFDTLAVALGFYTTVAIEPGGGEARVVEGPDLLGGEDLILAGMSIAAGAAGRPLPGCCVRVCSQIPVARGLGSSASALIAGLVAGNHLLGDPLSREALLELATTVEGHGDNVSASLYGGVTLAVQVEGGVLCRPVPCAVPLRAVIFIPEETGMTSHARAVLPGQIPRGDAVANLGRVGLLVLALVTGDLDLLAEAMADRLHQPYRAGLFPYVVPLVDAALDAGAYGACLSGAGPSVLALVAPERAAAVRLSFQAAADARRVDGRAVELDVVEAGVEVREGEAVSA